MDVDSSAFYSAQAAKNFLSDLASEKTDHTRQDDYSSVHQGTNNNYSLPTDPIGFHTCWAQALTTRNTDASNPRDKLSSKIQANRAIKATTPAHPHKRRPQKQR